MLGQLKTDKRPNVLVILIDDAGYMDFGFMGCKDIPTPNIDRLAAMGTVFTDAHVTASVCSPSRAGIMTGRYQQRMGFEANGTGNTKIGDIGISDESITMADVFKKSGYQTYAVGKWHLGSSHSDHPNKRGFDDFYGFIGGSRSYFETEKSFNNGSDENKIQFNGSYEKFDGYLTDVFGDKAIDFINKSDKPFFMYLAFNAVHTPMEAKEVDLKKFEGHPRQKLAAMTWCLDQNIGKILANLQSKKELDNTLIYFLSDNGGAHENQSSMGAFKGWKGNEFEGGHRVPFVISWPQGGVPKNKTYSNMVSSLDIFTTSLAAANIKSKSLKLDGSNLIPYIKGQKKNKNPHDFLYWRKLNKSAVRMNNYKLVSLPNFGEGLYDLQSDIGENNNLIHTQQGKKILKKISKEYNVWTKKMSAPLWDEDKVWVDIVDHITESLLRNQKPQYRDPWEKKAIETNKAKQ